MLAMKGEHDLLFCMHHGRLHLDQLILEGWEVDEDFASIEAPVLEKAAAPS